MRTGQDGGERGRSKTRSEQDRGNISDNTRSNENPITQRTMERAMQNEGGKEEEEGRGAKTQDQKRLMGQGYGDDAKNTLNKVSGNREVNAERYLGT